MKVFRAPLKNKDQTGSAMHKMTRATAGDLRRMKFQYNGKVITGYDLPLRAWFDFVRCIPYRADPKPREIIARPAHIARFCGLGADCKKKAIMIAAWLQAHDVPWRFVASSRRRDKKKHHVYPQGKISGDWLTLDATYKHYYPGMRKKNTAEEILKG
ncbi:hypothetical protein EH223_08535 [candidate division KSB1 bacterium]|nr:MAG: hypothetical protein EH223_08535 [candidate division KSB1 bacterium]